MRLKDKVALITGGGRGIGEATALRFSEEGAKVVINDVDMENANKVAEKIKANGGDVLVLKADVSDKNEVEGMIEQVQEHFGRLDVLVNNAGINIPQDSVDVTVEAWDQIIDINLKASFFMAQAVGRVMIRQGHGGRIINMSSQTGSVALIKRAGYCASKAGLNLVTKVLALEWASHGILVNAVAPTFIETELSKGYLADPEFREYALAKNLLKRIGTPEDVLGAVLYLASPASSLVTGHILMVDAGWSAH